MGVLSITSIICGGIASILGTLVLLGWYANIPTLIQIHPSFVAMQYNTALGFLFCGGGLLAVNFFKNLTARISAIFLLLLGGLTLIQYIFGLNLGIDQLLMEHYIDLKASRPGRMAPNTALCFFLVGCSLGVSSKFAKNNEDGKVIGILGSLIFSLGTVAFFGYLMEVETAYGWGNLTRMAVHTGLGFIILGLGVVMYAWKIDVGEKSQIPNWLPILVGIASFTTMLLLWQAESNARNGELRKQVQLTSNQIKSELQTELQSIIKGLNRLAKRWDVREIPAEEEFVSDADLYRADHSSIELIAWLDPKIYVRWITPLESNKKYIGAELPQVWAQQKALNNLRNTRQTLSFTVKLQDGKQGIIILIPIFRDMKFHGFVSGVIGVEKIFEQILDSPYVQGFSSLLFQEIDPDKEKKLIGWEESLWLVKANFNVSGKAWELWLKPNQQWIDAQGSSKSILILIVGSLISFLLMALVRLIMRTRENAKETVKANEALKSLQEKMEKINELLLEGAVEGIYGLDMDGKTTFVNPAGASMVGYTAEEMIGKPQHTLIHHTKANGDPYLREDCHIYAAFMDGKVHHEENEVFWRKDGSCFPVEYTSRPIMEGDKITGAVVTFSDITERKQAEEELQKINKKSDTALELTKSGYWHIPFDESGFYNSSEKAVTIFGDLPKPDHRYHIMDEWYANVVAGNKEIAEETLENYKGAIEGRYPIYDTTFAYKRPIDGNVVWIHALGYIVRDEHWPAPQKLIQVLC